MGIAEKQKAKFEKVTENYQRKCSSANKSFISH